MSGQVWYSLFNLLAFILAFIITRRLKMPLHARLSSNARTAIFAGLVIGVIVGAKIPLIMSHGFTLNLLITGKSILGALIGAYFGVNIAKRLAGIKGYYGDRYVIPICAAVAVAKVGCLLNGCCGGRETAAGFSMLNPVGIRVYPVQIICIIFHLALIPFFYTLYRKNLLPGLHYVLYLFIYCVYRFSIEFVRNEPRILAGFTAYQVIAAAGILYFGFEFIRRAWLEENLNRSILKETS